MLWFLAACVEPDETATLPAGGFFSSTGTALGQAAACLAGFPESPAAQAAARWRELARSCPGEVYGEGALAALNPECRAAPAAVIALRGTHSAAFGAPRGANGMVHGTLGRTEKQAWQAEIRLPLSNDLGALALAVPSAESPGPNVLNHKDALLHARVRPQSGIDIASLVPENTQADNLFNLKSALLSRAVLSGTWELAIYPAPAGQIMPQSVLALGVHATAARPAIDTFAAQLREKWNVQRVPTTVAAWQGECIQGMRILPGLEPCYLLDEQSLVIGWNDAALQQAVSGAFTPLELGNTSGAIVDFRVMAAADAILAESVDPTVRFPPIRYPTDRVSMTAVRQGNMLITTLESHSPCEP